MVGLLDGFAVVGGVVGVAVVGLLEGFAVVGANVVEDGVAAVIFDRYNDLAVIDAFIFFNPT